MQAVLSSMVFNYLGGGIVLKVVLLIDAFHASISCLIASMHFF
jgi:hypothetical protein